MSTYRKLSSNIILDRINPNLDAKLAPTQQAYRENGSTGNVVLAQKYLVAVVKSGSICDFFFGVEMSRAFETVVRSKLIGLFRKLGVDEATVGLLELLLGKTHLATKRG